MNKTIFVYAVGLYATAICFGLYLNTAHGSEYYAPAIAWTDHPRAIEAPQSCREYLEICESSCAHREGMFRFLCLGQDFNPDTTDRFRCQCGDEMLRQQPVQAEPVQMESGK